MYVTSLLITVTAGSSRIGFVRIHSDKRSDKYDGIPQIALSSGFAFFCRTALDQNSAKVTCRSAGYQRLVQYGLANTTGSLTNLQGTSVTNASCSGDEVNLKSCVLTLTLGDERCEDDELQYIECDSPAEEVPSLGKEKP